MAAECSAKQAAGKMAAAVGVQDQTVNGVAAAGIFQRFHAQLRLHMLHHGKPMNAAVETVQHCRQVELSSAQGICGISVRYF